MRVHLQRAALSALAFRQLRAHHRLREEPGREPAARFAQAVRQLGQVFDDARLDAEPVELLDDWRSCFQ